VHNFKVLHVIPAIAPRYGGPSQVVLEMCRNLLSEGVDTVLATTNADVDNQLQVKLGELDLYKEVPTIFFSKDFSESFKFSSKLAKWLHSHVRDFDLVHIHAIFSHSSLTAGRACQKYRVPYIVRPLGSLDPWSLKRKRFLKYLLWSIGARRMLLRASVIHFTTTEERMLASKLIRLNNGEVIPLGIDDSFIKAKRNGSQNANSKKYVLSLSRIDPKKGLELFIDSFLRIIKVNEFKDWELIIAGDGDTKYVNKLKSYINKNDAHSRIFLTGWLNQDEKIEYLKNASLLAMPSYQENFGLSAVEAMACGVPVLVSEHVNLKNEINSAKAGWVVELNRDSIENALMEILRDKDVRKERGKLGKDLVKSKFTWPIVTKQLIELYGEILGK